MFVNSLNFLFCKKINLSRLGKVCFKGSFYGDIRVRSDYPALNGDKNICQREVLVVLTYIQKREEFELEK